MSNDKLLQLNPAKDSSALAPNIRWLQYLLYGGLLLYFGRDVLIPLSFAALVSFVLYPVCAWLERRGIGRLTAIILSVTMIIVLGLLVLALLLTQLVAFIEEWPILHAKMYQSFQENSTRSETIL